MNCRLRILLASIIATGWISFASAGGRVSVLVGGEADLDACGGYGVVTGLDPNRDGFLAVRTGPGTDHSIIDKINNGQAVYFCDERQDWIGIVYSRDKGVDCQIGSPIAKRQPYTGPCRAGWAHAKYLRLVAG